MSAAPNNEKTAWTPGPWEADPECGNIHVSGDQIASAWVPRHRDEPIPEREANAHLISAAPDLFEALAAIVTPTGFANLDASGLGTHAAALAALSKAQGQ